MDEKQLAWGILAFCLLILSVGLKSIVNMVIILIIGILMVILAFVLQIEEAESERASENI